MRMLLKELFVHFDLKIDTFEISKEPSRYLHSHFELTHLLHLMNQVLRSLNQAETVC